MRRGDWSDLHDISHLLPVNHARVVSIVQLEAPQQFLLYSPDQYNGWGSGRDKEVGSLPSCHQVHGEQKLFEIQKAIIIRVEGSESL